jgi:uncharacterized membrane protein HdeD (DUF308 family)
MTPKKGIPTGWLLMVIGFIFIGIGVFILLYPWHAYYRLTKYTWILLLMNAVLLLYIAANRTRGTQERNWVLAESTVDFLFVLIFLFNALLSLIVLPLFIATWMGLMGGMKIAGAIALKRKISGWGFLLVEGIISVLFSIWTFHAPSTKAVNVTIPIGLFALLMGTINIIEAVRFKKKENTLDMML